MISVTLARVYLYLVAFVSICLLVYFWHYKPMNELHKLQEDKRNTESVHKIDTIKSESFTDKYKELKEQIKPKEIEHDEVNHTIGKHTIIIK